MEVKTIYKESALNLDASQDIVIIRMNGDEFNELLSTLADYHLKHGSSKAKELFYALDYAYALRQIRWVK